MLKQLVHVSAVRSLMKHLGSLESTQEARVAQGILLDLRFSRALQISHMLHFLMNTR